jgi:hypothetical protein
MAESLLYHDYLIVASAQFNPVTKSWTGRADISSEYNGTRESHQLIGPRDWHSTERAAVYFMIAAARNWIEAGRRNEGQNGS